MSAPRTCWISDLGEIDFPTAHSLQLKILEARISGASAVDGVLLLEHPPVVTLGRGAALDHLKISPDELRGTGVQVSRIERGGDITYHGPGQLVLYPIFHLKSSAIGVREFVVRLEEVMIRTVRDFGVFATRDPRNHGVWANGKKLGFIGIALRRGVSFHGLSLNVNPSLTPFTWMTPCGLQDVKVTSLARETAPSPPMASVKNRIQGHLEDIFNICLVPVTRHQLQEGVPSNLS